MPELWAGCLESIVFVSFINYILSIAKCLVGHMWKEAIDSTGGLQVCVLTGKEIYRRRDDIFSRKSWDRQSFQEASYDLRVDTGPVLRIEGKLYENGIKYKGSHLRIEPGEMALLPTIESFNMPNDLVGDIKIKFSHSRQGLTPLIGPKVDPYFGKGHPDERLYLWVSNLGLSPITIRRGERVFNVQFHKLFGESPDFEPKVPTGPMVAQEAYAMGSDQSLGFIDKVERNVKSELGDRLTAVEEGANRVVVFGVFLVASAILAGTVTTLLVLAPTFNTDSGSSVVEALKGDSLFKVLYWASIAAALAVSALAGAIILPILKSILEWIIGGTQSLFMGCLNGIRRLNWNLQAWNWRRKNRK